MVMVIENGLVERKKQKGDKAIEIDSSSVLKLKK
jgi:hypothetical protein